MTEAYFAPARILASNVFPDQEHKGMDACIKSLAYRETLSSGLNNMDLDIEVDLVFDVIHLATLLTMGNSAYAKLEKPHIMDLLLQDEEVTKAVQYAAREGEYQLIRNLATFRKDSNDQYLGQRASATVKAWSQEYVGKVPDALYSAMEAHCRASRFREIYRYGRFISIVQSSGMGKSRAVDELSKQHFVIPINLRSPDAKGFPPSDGAARNFLTNSSTEPYQRARAFITALFTITYRCLERMDDHIAKAPGFQDQLKMPNTDALNFRFLMTQGQSFSQPNQFRRDFFQDVVQHAKKLMEVEIDQTVWFSCQLFEMQEEEKDTPPNNGPDGREKLIQSVEELVSKLDSRLGQTEEYPDPIVVLAFDEAHLLHDKLYGGHLSAYTGLRHALRIIERQPIFTVFLSTTSKLQEPTPLEAQKDDPGWLFKLLPPFTELGFDQMARQTGIARKGVDIEEIARPGLMAMFGRPLFGSRYLNGTETDKETIVKFAIDELSCYGTQPKDQVILACMAVRLALQFDSSTMEVQEVEKKQVEKHLRVCMLVHDRVERVISVAPSEPLLAEASRSLMLGGYYRFDMPASLLKILEIPGMDKCNRGELMAEVILLKAYDSAYASTKKNDTQMTNSATGQTRAVKLLTFVQNLLVLGKDDDLSEIYPTEARTQTEANCSFAKTFSDSWIYFNHFVRLDDGAVVKQEFIWRLILRGAVAICPNNDQGAHIIAPFLLEGKKIEPNNVAVVVIQVKNDGTFTIDPKPYLFDAMNLFGFHSANDDMSGKPPPIIRMVFALASSEATVSFLSADERAFLSGREGSTGYTTFDIWCAGASHQTFKVIGEGEEGNYTNLLQPKRTFPAAYEKGAESDPLWQLRNLRKQMNPGTATDIEHWRYLLEDDLPQEVEVPVAKHQYEDDEMDVE